MIWARDSSLSLQDLPNNLVINYGIDLPFGRGEMYLSNVGRVTDAVVGGWRVDGITIYRSGIPMLFELRERTQPVRC